jgi:hypothetical protein
MTKYIEDFSKDIEINSDKNQYYIKHIHFCLAFRMKNNKTFSINQENEIFVSERTYLFV